MMSVEDHMVASLCSNTLEAIKPDPINNSNYEVVIIYVVCQMCNPLFFINFFFSSLIHFLLKDIRQKT